MDEFDVKRLALILAVQAEIEGMKAMNKTLTLHKLQPEYGELAFTAKAEQLRNLAYSHNQQLF